MLSANGANVRGIASLNKTSPWKRGHHLRTGVVEVGIKKEAAQLTPDCTASNLKAKSWCLSFFESEYSPSRKNVPRPAKKFSSGEERAGTNQRYGAFRGARSSSAHRAERKGIKKELRNSPLIAQL
jgi:hypothetical protein